MGLSGPLYEPGRIRQPCRPQWISRSGSVTTFCGNHFYFVCIAMHLIEVPGAAGASSAVRGYPSVFPALAAGSAVQVGNADAEQQYDASTNAGMGGVCLTDGWHFRNWKQTFRCRDAGLLTSSRARTATVVRAFQEVRMHTPDVCAEAITEVLMLMLLRRCRPRRVRAPSRRFRRATASSSSTGFLDCPTRLPKRSCRR